MRCEGGLPICGATETLSPAGVYHRGVANLADSLARIGGSVAVGDLVAGKYLVEGLLGEGGMGVVLAARQTTLDRLVALKLLPAEAAKDQVLVGRFLREARAAARLQSDHVAKVIDVGTLPSGEPYMVMEHLQGADLGQVLASGGRLDVPTACDYVVQACHAVGEAHALGIVHRDLKPENLYLTTRLGGSAMIKVLDFGVSKVLTAGAGSLTSTTTAVGSPMYMAPEQMRASRATDARADVWALGVVLYELLTQRCPFEAETLPDLCLKVVGEPPVPIVDRRSDLPAELVEIIDRCLQKDPGKRFADAGALAAALAPFVESSIPPETSSVPRLAPSLVTTATGTAPTLPAPPMPPRPRSRVPAVVALVGVIAIAAWMGLSRRAPSHAASAPAGFPATASPIVPAALPSLPPLPPAVALEQSLPMASSAMTPPPHPVMLQPLLPRPPRPAASAAPATPAAPATTDDIPAFR